MLKQFRSVLVATAIPRGSTCSRQRVAHLRVRAFASANNNINDDAHKHQGCTDHVQFFREEKEDGGIESLKRGKPTLNITPRLQTKLDYCENLVK
eukprot:GEZU01000100.1.p1 GENE.GEZU01000100.1~~GEZU01000100.1.p1  ORF type:complete len:108 (-),score=9.70 GEZU01000100.1:17-301(-)